MNQQTAVKYHPFISLLTGAGFLAAVQTAASPHLNYGALVPFGRLWLWFLGLVVALTLYNRWYLALLDKMNIWTMVRPVLLLCGAIALFLAAPSPFIRGVFLLLSIGVIAFFESALTAFSENLLINETLFTAFGLFEGFGAWAYLYAPNQRFYFALAVFGLVFLLTRAFFEYTPQKARTKTAAALAMSLLCGEIFWTSGFLPQHFTVIALSLTAVFYCGLIINYHYLFNNLDFKKIQFHLMVAAVCVGLAFVSTPWRIVS